ncbi:MAG: rhomboid family intramembrane serine protease [Thermoleophilaceae bacterium]|nr:rhomboid family intramembrane serine protease [Thermoleophilaceae bacterium]
MFPLKDDIPTRRFPVLTVAIIAINIVMFFGFQGAYTGSEEKFNERVVEYGAIPYEISHPGEKCEDAGGRLRCEGQEGAPDDVGEQAPTWLTLLTSMFMHGGLLHLGGNMLFLWIFGNNIEDSMGRPRFVLFYLLGGLAALLAQTLIEPGSAVPTIGASGAVAAILGAYALLYPKARVVTVIFIIIFVTILELPALLVLGAWFLLQALNGAGSLAQPVGEGGGVAYFAHIGGFIFGLIMIRLFANRVHEDYRSAHGTPASR